MRIGKIRRISKKKRKQLLREKELTAILWEKQNGLCADCGRALRFGSAKHEIKFRSQGGDPTDENNCILLCLPCHSKRHGIRIIEDGL